MSKITLYHNPKCSKSRASLALLRSHHIEPVIIDYLTYPLSQDALSSLLVVLNLPAKQMLRTGETVFKALELSAEELSASEILALIAEHPILMQRPIVVNGDKAVIGRPPETLLEII